MLCEQVLGKLNEFDTTGKEIETVDIEWHEAFKRIHKKNTDKGTEVGIRMDDSILSRGLYQDDVIYADDEKLVVVNTPPCEVIRVTLIRDMRRCLRRYVTKLETVMHRFFGVKMIPLLRFIMSQCL